LRGFLFRFLLRHLPSQFAFELENFFTIPSLKFHQLIHQYSLHAPVSRSENFEIISIVFLREYRWEGAGMIGRRLMSEKICENEVAIVGVCWIGINWIIRENFPEHAAPPLFSRLRRIYNTISAEEADGRRTRSKWCYFSETKRIKRITFYPILWKRMHFQFCERRSVFSERTAQIWCT